MDLVEFFSKKTQILDPRPIEFWTQKVQISKTIGPIWTRMVSFER